MSARSWNHRIAPMSAEDIEQWRRIGWHCSWPKCKAPSTHLATYDYVTGRAGRVSDADRRYCDEHAARFAEKHGLAVAS